MRERRTWRELVLSSGEISAKQKIEEANKGIVHTGQRIRFLDIPIDGKVIANTHGHLSEKFVGRLKESSARFYGTAGPAFVEKLILRVHSRQELVQEVRRDLHTWVDAVATLQTLAPAEQRALQRFALLQVAGARAVDMGILPYDLEQIDDAIMHVWRIWINDGGNLDDAARGVQKVREFIEKNLFSRFADRAIENPNCIRELAGYRDDKAGLILFNDSGFREACGGYDPKVVARQLLCQGLIHLDETTRIKSKHTVKSIGDRKRFYTVKMRIIEDD